MIIAPARKKSIPICTNFPPALYYDHGRIDPLLLYFCWGGGAGDLLLGAVEQPARAPVQRGMDGPLGGCALGGRFPFWNVHLPRPGKVEGSWAGSSQSPPGALCAWLRYSCISIIIPLVLAIVLLVDCGDRQRDGRRTMRIILWDGFDHVYRPEPGCRMPLDASPWAAWSLGQCPMAFFTACWGSCWGRPPA